MVTGFVIANIFSTVWAWIVWIVIGGLAGAVADRLIQGDQLGIVGNIVVGIIGGLLGGIILSLFGIDVSGIIFTFITSLLGAIALLWVAKKLTNGRGIGGRSRRKAGL
ncbi:MAG TPA: GlsB/YeaQ/YmgE family stress response membrane protein [Ktedonosporobacter sp.]|nr:GlsB/YeaQ/YmgE family stress response membrane protein [Ktedonosporobacter sp.]